MSVVWHNSLTTIEDKEIENIQKTSLIMILGESFEDYSSSLAKTGIKSLSEWRKTRCLSFAKRCLKNPQTKQMFPLNLKRSNSVSVRHTEKYLVSYARTENYGNSAIPYCQRLLNEDNKQEQERMKEGRELAGHQGREGARARREGS